MKRIEAVITPWTLDTFKEAAPGLGISEFDVVEVFRSGCALTDGQQRLYRGREFRADLLPRLRLEFVLFDDDVQATLHRLLELVHPESIAIFRLDRTIAPAKCHLNNSPLRQMKTNQREAPTCQFIGFLPRGAKDSDISSNISLPPTANDNKRGH